MILLYNKRTLNTTHYRVSIHDTIKLRTINISSIIFEERLETNCGRCNMSAIKRLYKKENYTIQKSINLEDKLYTELKKIVEKEYDATISDIVNVCIEDLISSGNIKYYAKPDEEITIYRSVMIRKENVEALNKITQETGISLTRLVNIAMREFLDKNVKK